MDEIKATSPVAPNPYQDVSSQDIKVPVSVAPMLSGAWAARSSASFGLAAIEQQDRSFGDILTRADRALYEAKAQGRNRVVVAPS